MNFTCDNNINKPAKSDPMDTAITEIVVIGTSRAVKNCC